MLNGGQPLGSGSVSVRMQPPSAWLGGVTTTPAGLILPTAASAPEMCKVGPPGPAYACITPFGTGVTPMYAEWPFHGIGGAVLSKDGVRGWRVAGRLSQVDTARSMEYDTYDFRFRVAGCMGDEVIIDLRVAAALFMRLQEEFKDLPAISVPPPVPEDALTEALRDLRGLVQHAVCPTNGVAIAVESRALETMASRVEQKYRSDVVQLLVQSLREACHTQGTASLVGRPVNVLWHKRRLVADVCQEVGIPTAVAWNQEVVLASVTSYRNVEVEAVANVLTPILVSLYGKTPVGGLDLGYVQLHWFEDDGGNARGAYLPDSSHMVFWPLGVRL